MANAASCTPLCLINFNILFNLDAIDNVVLRIGSNNKASIVTTETYEDTSKTKITTIS